MPHPPVLRATLALALVAVTVAASGCKNDPTYSGGCLSGKTDCRVSAPCTKLAFTCAGESLDIHTLAPAAGATRGGPTGFTPGGSNAMAVAGDIQLSNGKVVAVIAGLGHQNFLDPNGGGILDLSTKGDDNDGLNQLIQVTGILPGDALHYTSLEIIDERPTRVAVQLKGTLDGYPHVPVATLYELRPCDPGLRIRTEVTNLGNDQLLLFTSDGFYWSKREPIPFNPTPGQGFEHPAFGITTINDAYKTFPYIAASMHAAPYSSYALVGCNVKQLEGFNSESISAAGLARTVVPPRQFQVFERFFGVANGKGVDNAIAIAQDVRHQLFEEQYVTISGKVERPGALALDSERETSIVISEGTLDTDAKARTPWTQVVPDASGQFRAHVPAGKNFVIEVHSFGQKQAEKELSAVSADTDAGTFTLPSTARIVATVSNGLNGQPLDAELLVIPADSATLAARTGTFHGQFGSCAPWLGPPPGGSPACNRVLTTRTGPTTFEIPTGDYWLYAFKGPFWTIARQRVTLTPTTTTVTLEVRELPLQPLGTLNADLHVHGSASFDSQIPDLDRVLSFAAVDMDVVISTDHEVVNDYSAMVRQLGLQDRLTTVTGTETTGHIPFMRVPNYGFPLVIGHYNLWPLHYDPTQPRNGAPYDELVEPGQMFDQMDDRGLWAATNSVIELNHPYADAEFGRDLGFPKAIFLDATKDLPADDDGTNNGVYVRALGRLRNNAHQAQEVMNGTRNDTYLQYRAFWFYTLNQGQLKTGTANSDSHSLVDSTIGSPRNVVITNTQAGPGFDIERFNGAIRSGAVLGTNGPVIEATLDGADGHPHSYGLAPFAPAADAKLHVEVRAAPWVPVQEVRFIVNGKVAKTIGSPEVTTAAADPFDQTGVSLTRWQGDVAVSELLAGVSGDAWIVVEAGHALVLSGDLGGGVTGQPDGIPDTGDNNGDGQVNKADVATGKAVGPLLDPPVPTAENDPQVHFSRVVTDGFPAGFTNPFVLDRNGNGKFDAPGVSGGR